jgi:hypothetical protein
MRPLIYSGIALIIVGALALGQYSYTTRESVFKLGPIEATAEKQHTFHAPPAVGWALCAGGIGLLIVGATRKRQ